MRSVGRRAQLLLVAGLALCGPALSCLRVPQPPPSAVRTPEHALEELSPDAFPTFSDDLDFSGLDLAIGHSLDALKRLAAADPGRTFGFGKERVPLTKLVATLVRFREIALAHPTKDELNRTLRSEFRVFRSVGDGTSRMLITGYYLPELRGSLQKDDRYQVPLHAVPEDLVQVSAKDFPQLSEDVVGRVDKGRLIPYRTRAEVAGGALDLAHAELLFVDSAVDAFFLEVQGSGIVELPDGTSRVLTYAGKNGHRFEAVGAELVRRGALHREDVSMQAVREYLKEHPDEVRGLLDRNPSYVFFRFADAPIGALSVPVTADRTVAADTRVFPKCSIAFLESERPTDSSPTSVFQPFSRFVLDQDAGGAIRTSERLDLFFGSGSYAESAAGRMRQPGRLYYLLLR